MCIAWVDSYSGEGRYGTLSLVADILVCNLPVLICWQSTSHSMGTSPLLQRAAIKKVFSLQSYVIWLMLVLQLSTTADFQVSHGSLQKVQAHRASSNRC